MKKNNYSIFLLIFLFLVSGCQDVKKGFSGKKIDKGEEFLVIKKNPLVVPPDFEELPTPTLNEGMTEENIEDEKLSIQEILSSGSNDTSKKQSENQSIEKFILGQIKKD